MPRLPTLPPLPLCLLLLTASACGDADGGVSQTSDPGTTAEPGSATDAPTTGAPTTTLPPTTTVDPSTTTATDTTTGDAPTTTTGDDTTAATTTGDEDTTTGAVELEHFLLGVHLQDVSPSEAHLDANVYMGAYGAPFTRGAAQGVHDEIYARSLAIEGNGGGVVLSIVDLPGMGNRITRSIRTKVAELTGLPEAHVLVGSTHSHSAPDLMGLWGGVPAAYRTWLIDQVATSMATAWANREPGELRVATGKAPANNRRDWGYTDDDMTILDAVDLNAERLGTFVVFASHPVILGEGNKLISCDFPGFAVQALEAVTGAPALLFNGTLGDATPKVPEGDYADGFERADAYGSLLAAIAADLIESAEPIEPTLVVDDVEWTQNIDNNLFQLAALLGLLQYDFEMQGLQQTVTTQATYFRLGTKVQGISFPGESVTRNGLEIKESMTAPHKILLGNTGDALGYFIPSDEWQTGKNNNYEEGVSLGKTAGDNARDAIVPLITADPF